MQTVIKLSPNQLAKLVTHYQPWQSGSSLPPGALLRAQYQGVTITAYKSGKVLFQGSGSQQVAQPWQPGDADQPAAGTHKKSTTSGSLPAGFASWSVLGSDEVGAGAYFGPLTTAAVFVAHQDLDWVRQLGIMDSKVLSDQQIQKIGPQIIARLPHHVVNLMPTKYNQLQQQYNVVALKALSHNFALKQVLAKVNPAEVQGILIDQFAAPTTFNRYLKQAGQTGISQPKEYFTTKGERHHLSVAAASILARLVELDSMKKLSEAAGTKLPIGAGKHVDEVAAQLIRRQVPLKDFAKLHFANTQKAEKLAQRQ
ncbi:ribonuclease HIII [Leuconostocaceae bacterium ESL0723]|nr:ribonuclease HIII [Leuconostocaceae bacterium ESL0723]